MREIKFRGKSKSKGEWLYGDFITDTKEYNRTCDKVYILPYWDKLNCPVEVEGESVGQYTGLKDKNGREVYEGDIVWLYYNGFHDNEKAFEGEVIFEEGSFSLNKKDEYTCLHDGTGLTIAEVIGNVYENKELLD